MSASEFFAYPAKIIISLVMVSFGSENMCPDVPFRLAGSLGFLWSKMDEYIFCQSV